MKVHNSDSSFVFGAKGIWLVLLMLFLTLFAFPARAQIVINEVMANNQATAASPEAPDYFPDYIELYNTSGIDIDLGSSVVPWQLKDSGTNLFAFRPQTIIPAHGFLLIFCDDDLTVPGIHTGFGLNATEGETVFLYRNFAVTEFVTLGIQAPDLSLGRVPDGTGAFQLGTATPDAANVAIPLGNPFGLRINEWLATNSAGADRDWFEVYNPDTNAVSLSGLVFADRGSVSIVNFLRPTPANSFIAPFGFVQIFASSKANDADEVDFSLSSTLGDDIYMFANNSSTGQIDHITFQGGQQRNESEGRLPDGGPYRDGNLNNIKLKNLSPAASNFGTIPEIVISEFLAHVDPPLEDAIELHNPTTTNISVGGWWLTDDRNTPKKYKIPAGTIIEAGGFHVFYEYQFNGRNPDPFDLNFNLNSAHGGEIYLFKADPDGELLGFRRGVSFGASENGVSFGRWVNSETNTDIVPMASLTFGTSITRTNDPSLTNVFRTGPGAPNSYPKVGPFVINEIHYHPTNGPGAALGDDNTLDEFLEVRNISPQALPLFDPVIYSYQGDVYADGRTNTWRIRGGISFNFPSNITVAADGYVLVVNFDPETNLVQLAAFTARFNIPPAVPIVGPYKGTLSNGGDTLELYRPDPPQGPPLHDDERGFVPYTLADLVKYNDEPPWPITTNTIGPDGLGQSLQRIVASDFGNEPQNWRGADPTPGAANGPIGLAVPVITLDPSSVATVDRADATFTVAATGVDLHYRWQFNGVQINGATSNILTIVGVTTNNVGRYRAAVINGAGIVYSEEAELQVVDSGAVTNDHQAPTVNFTAPPNGSQRSIPNVTVEGTAFDNLAVSFVELSINDGPFFRAVGTRTWSADLTLFPGLNTIRARATDLNTNESVVAVRTITYTTNTVNLSISGQGTIKGLTSTTPLIIGNYYTVVAQPSSGWVFLRWAGDAPTNSTSPSLTFQMQTGLSLTAVFVSNPFGGGVSGTYNGLFYEETEIRPETAGYFTFNLTSRGTYTAQLYLQGKRYTSRGTLDLFGQGTSTVVRPAPLPPLTVNWIVDVEGGTDTVEGTMSTDTWTNSIVGDRATHHVLYNRAMHGGRYTFAMPGVPGSLTQPQGDSYGSIQIGSNGRVIMAGTLADNTKISHNTTISKNGDIPVYVSLYRGKGIFFGWINMGPAAPTNRFTGRLSWIKPGGLTDPASRALYPLGFTNETPVNASIIGSVYEAPVFTNRVLNAGQAALNLLGGELDPGFSGIVDLQLGGNVTYSGVDKVTISVGKLNGLYTGTWTRQGTKTPIRFGGAFFQTYTNAFGFTLGTNQIGRVTIEADR